MSATTIGINEPSYQWLFHLVEQTGRPATVILEQALADYERKVCGGKNDTKGRTVPAAAEEAELLEDAGSIHMPPRARREVFGHIVPAAMHASQLGADPGK